MTDFNLAITHLGEAQRDRQLRVKTVKYINNSLRQPGASPPDPLLQMFMIASFFKSLKLFEKKIIIQYLV